MRQHTAGEHDVDPADVRAALAELVANEPALPSGTDDIERRGRHRRARRRLAGLAMALAAAGAAAATALAQAGPPAGPPSGSVAAPPVAPGDGGPGAGPAGGPAGGAQLAVGFTVDAAVTAVLVALPAGVSVGELPMDIGWRAGGTLDLPLDGTGRAGVLTIRITGGSCAVSVAPAGVLPHGDLDAVTESVCAAWVAAGSSDIVPAEPAGPEQPELADQ
jgi:hypothetical protein